jgi:uncharacterized protein
VIRAVFDANLIVAALPAKSGSLVTIVDYWRRGLYEVVVSEAIISEVEAAWSKPYWRNRLQRNQMLELLRLIRRRMTIVEITADVSDVAAHREDDLVLATAISAKTQILVTGDKEFLALGTYNGISILSPQTFLEMIRSTVD